MIKHFLYSLAESNEYTELDIDDILHNIDHEEQVSRRIQEQKDAVSKFYFFIIIIFICCIKIYSPSI